MGFLFNNCPIRTYVYRPLQSNCSQNTQQKQDLDRRLHFRSLVSGFDATHRRPFVFYRKATMTILTIAIKKAALARLRPLSPRAWPGYGRQKTLLSISIRRVMWHLHWESIKRPGCIDWSQKKNHFECHCNHPKISISFQRQEDRKGQNEPW